MTVTGKGRAATHAEDESAAGRLGASAAYGHAQRPLEAAAPGPVAAGCACVALPCRPCRSVGTPRCGVRTVGVWLVAAVGTYLLAAAGEGVPPSAIPAPVGAHAVQIRPTTVAAK